MLDHSAMKGGAIGPAPAMGATVTDPSSFTHNRTMHDFTLLVVPGAFASSVTATLDILATAATVAQRRGLAAPRWRVCGPQPGAVAPLDSIQVNLADGHYLRLGIALQLTTKAKEVDGSKALDAAIELFSGKSIEELTDLKEREKLKKELVKELEHLYEDEVMGVYFTQFVMQ